MKKEIRTEIRIQASPAVVWALLTQFEAYPAWNPFIRSVTGTVQTGQRIGIHITPPNSGGMRFRPRVLEIKAPQSLRWRGHLLLPGLFDGEHRFELLDPGDGSTLFTHSETFTGILVRFFQKQIDTNTRMGFEAMNQALKTLAEQNASPPIHVG